MTDDALDPTYVIAALRDATKAHPHQRVCQVIVNALGEDPFYVSDEEAAEMLFDYARQGDDA